MSKRISPVVLLAFIIAGLMGAVAFLYYYDQAFPEASLDLRIGRNEAIGRSREFLAGQGFDLTGYRNVAVFQRRQSEADFLERTLGLKKANQLFRDTVAVFRWQVRWFKEFQQVEYSVEYTPDGRLVQFSKKLPESEKGERLPEDQARELAENFLRKDLALDLSNYTYLERKMYDRPDRLDQDFVLRLNGFDIGDSQYRLAVTVQGDQVGGFDQWVRIPEEYSRARDELTSKRMLLAQADYIFLILLNVGLFAVFFWRIYRKDVRWKISFCIAGAAFLITLLSELNQIPLATFSYDTTESMSAFWMKHLEYSVIRTIGAFVTILVTIAAADSMGRLSFAGQPHRSGIFTREYLGSAEARSQFLAGYGLALAAVGYVTLFYVLGQKFLHVWVPVDIPISNSFSTYFPSGESISVGFMAGLNEELTFRLFGIALLLKLTRRPWLAVLIPAVIWGFAHTAYPQEPIWIRGLELSFAGVIYGIIFLRFGLITTLVSHYTYDCFVGVVPQLQSGNPGLIANGLFAVLLPILFMLLLPLLIAAINRIPSRSRPPRQPEPEQVPAPPEPAPVQIDLPVWQSLPSRRVWIFIIFSIAVFAAGKFLPKLDFYGKPAGVALTKDHAQGQCTRAMEGLGWSLSGFTPFTDFNDRVVGPPLYLIDQFGIRDAYQYFRNEFYYRPSWYSQWYKEKTIRTYSVSVDERGRLISLAVDLADQDPGSTLDEDATGKIASAFLAGQGYLTLDNWELIETKKIVRPNRWDYSLTYRDRYFEAADLERRLSMTVSGNTVTAFAQPYFKVPEEWERSREIKGNDLRNTVRRVISYLLMVAFVLFLIVWIVILIRRGCTRKSDLKWAAWVALFFCILKVVLENINDLPRFYQSYIYSTEQTLMNYTFNELIRIPMSLIIQALLAFSLFLALMILLRGFAPELGELKNLLAPLHPKRWGSKTNLQAVWLALGLVILRAGMVAVEKWLRMLLEPHQFYPEAVGSGIDLNQISESFRLAVDVPQVLFISTGLLAAAIIIRRFLKNEAWRMTCFILIMMIFSGTESLSYSEMLREWMFDLAYLFIFYLVVTRIFKWNLMAYVIFFWIDQYRVRHFESLKRFLCQSSPDFFWPVLQDLLWMILPVVIFIAVALWQRRREKRIGLGPDLLPR